MEIDLKNFNSADMPLTESKKDAIVDLLTQTEKFLKFNYVLKEIPIKCKLSELYEQYKDYVSINAPDYKCERLVEFSSNMKNLGFVYKPIGGYNHYRISYDSLKGVADKKHWLHHLDNDIIATNKKSLHDPSIDEDYEYGLKKNDFSVKITIEEEILFYKNKIRDLEEERLQQWNQHALKFKKETIQTETKTQADKIKDLFNSAADSFF
jgi:phage pi2 protein 07